jgi:uracil-DNA glycosylase
MNNLHCPVCGLPIISSAGNPSKVLVISDEPTVEDLQEGKSFMGAYGMILRGELAKHGLDLWQFRRTCLWLHQFSKDKREKEWHYQQALQEAKDKKIILLLGSETTQTFLKHSSTEISGLQLKSDYFGADWVMGTVSPLSVLSGGCGEFKLAIQKFADYYAEWREKV